MSSPTSAPSQPADPRDRTRGRVLTVAVLVDVVCVLVFALAGRNAHESGSLLAVLRIASPFLAGLAATWLLVSARRLPALRVWPTGVVVVAGTYLIGMALRGLSGRGLAPAFLVVAALFLAATMLGWRAFALAKLHYRARRLGPADRG